MQATAASPPTLLPLALPHPFPNPYLPTPTSHPEYQYLSLVSTILAHGTPRPDRTGTGTLALFAPPPFRFSLANNTLPLLTTKRVALRVVFEELMFFIRGLTDATVLSGKGVKIWDGNGSRAALDARGLTHRREGDLGPVYGFQWRHFGARYVDCDTSYKGQGVDQLKEVVKLIMERPTDRRILFSAWNPTAVGEMALPPCHVLAQFFVTLPPPENNNGTTTDTQQQKPPRLSCQLYQRSADLGLGIPFNIASYALLTHMLAHVTGTQAHEFIHVMGDAHVYADHVEPLSEQVGREPRPFPTVRFGKDGGAGTVEEAVRMLEGLEWGDVRLEGYDPLPTIKMKMSV